jgi:hypothetical protein
MERLKQTIAKLETDIAELKQFQTKIQGSTQSKGDVHYCASTQEFGEYALDEIDTFRFAVEIGYQYQQNQPGNKSTITYKYHLLNPTPELRAYLKTQGKHEFSMDHQYTPILVNTENYEEYCMKKAGTPFVLTEEIRKCLDSKLWEFVKTHNSDPDTSRDFRSEFYIDIPITFEHEYTISPHVSFYITPLSNLLDGCAIHEITTKQVVFRIKYGNLPNGVFSGAHMGPRTIYSGLKLHYNINGIVKQDVNLLD